MTGILDTARAEALFASPIQPSQTPTPAEIRRAVRAVVHAIGVKGCACRVAVEYGEHPYVARNRMIWAITMVRITYRQPVTGCRRRHVLSAPRREPAAR